MVVIRAQQGCQKERATRWPEQAARIHELTTMRFPDVELKVDYNQPATTTGTARPACTAYG